MKKVMLRSSLLVAFAAVFQLEAVGRNGAGVNPNTVKAVYMPKSTDIGARASKIMLGTTSDSRSPYSTTTVGNLGGSSTTYTPKDIDTMADTSTDKPMLSTTSKDRLGRNSLTFTPSNIQLGVLRLKEELTEAAEFIHDIAQGLANLKKDRPDIFEHYFEDNDAQDHGFAPDLDPLSHSGE